MSHDGICCQPERDGLANPMAIGSIWPKNINKYTYEKDHFLLNDANACSFCKSTDLR